MPLLCLAWGFAPCLACRLGRRFSAYCGVPPLSIRCACPHWAVRAGVPHWAIRAGVPPVSVRAGVPPVSIRVIVRSAHSALVRKLHKPRSEQKPRGTERRRAAGVGSRRRAAGVSSRNRSLRSLCTRKEAL